MAQTIPMEINTETAAALITGALLVVWRVVVPALTKDRKHDTGERARVLIAVASDYQAENRKLESELEDQKQALEAAQATIKEQAELIIELRRQLDKYIQD